MSLSTLRPRPRRTFKWNESRTDRADDLSWIDQIRATRSEHHSAGCEESYLDLFLDASDQSPLLDSERVVFGRVFRNGDLEKIDNGVLQQSPDVWLNDVDGNNRPRPYNGLMPLAVFKENIEQKRSQSATGEGQPAIDAVRRRIHCQNPSPSTLGLLALHASEEQKPVLKEILYRYLKADTHIDLKAAKSGLRAFVLQMHLPCFVWRKRSTPRADRRPTTNDEPLRKSSDLSFLSATKNGKGQVSEIDFLHECQTSIFMTGWDTLGWTALCLADSYFDDEMNIDNPYMLAYYFDKSKDPDSRDDDPISIGKLMADATSLKDVREYFLAVFVIRLQRIADEWDNVEFHLSERAREYLDNPHIPLHRRNTNLGTADLDSSNVEDSEVWFKQISCLLTELMTSLSGTLTSITKFVDEDCEGIDELADGSISPRIQDSLWDTRKPVKQMEKVFEKLKNLQAKVDTFESHLGLHIAVDGGRINKLQHLNVTILQVFSPMALAGTVIQAGIKFSNVYVSYLAFTVIFTAVTMNLQRAIRLYHGDFGGGNKVTDLPKAEAPEAEPESQATRTGFALPNPATGFQRMRRKFTWKKDDADSGV